MSPIYLKGEELIAIDSDAPRRVHLGNDPAIKLENRVGGVVRCCGIRFAMFVRTLRNMGDSQRGHRANGSEKIVQKIAPVRKHIDHDSAAIFCPVIPRGALRFLPISLKNPIAKLSANRKDSAEKAVFDEGFQLSETG